MQVITSFGFDAKRIKPESRLYNKILGGGALLDVGCYPLSLSTLLNSLSYNVDLSNIRLENVKTLHCEGKVDVYSEAEFNFGNKFSSKIVCSFKDKLNQNSKIYFEQGLLDIQETWVPSGDMSIKMTNHNKNEIINFKINENIYSYQIENISKELLNKNSKANFPAISIDEIEINTKLLEDWINYKQF